MYFKFIFFMLVTTSSVALPHGYLELKGVASDAVAPARRSLEARDRISTTAKNVISSAASLAVKGAVAVKDNIVQKGKDAFTGAHIQAFLVQKHAGKLDNAVAIATAASPFAGPAGPILVQASTAVGAASHIAQHLPQIPEPSTMAKQSTQAKEQKPAQPQQKSDGRRSRSQSQST